MPLYFRVHICLMYAILLHWLVTQYTSCIRRRSMTSRFSLMSSITVLLNCYRFWPGKAQFKPMLVSILVLGMTKIQTVVDGTPLDNDVRPKVWYPYSAPRGVMQLSHEVRNGQWVQWHEPRADILLHWLVLPRAVVYDNVNPFTINGYIISLKDMQ